MAAQRITLAILLGALSIGVVQTLGCASWRRTAPLPTGSTLRVGQLVIHSDFPLSPEHRLLTDLNQLRGRIAEQLALPAGGEPVEVFLFQTPQSYQIFLKAIHPNLPDRRALFVETDTQLRVYAAWGDRVAEDLRHEVSHGYMHSMLPELPLWIDEGLAECFEVRADQRGLNLPHVEHLAAERRRGAWQPDMNRLAAIRAVDQMQQTEYAEAWAWMHWLLNSSPENRALLQAYLAALHEGQHPLPLEQVVQRQNAQAAAQLRAHLDGLAAPNRSTSELREGSVEGIAARR